MRLRLCLAWLLCAAPSSAFAPVTPQSDDVRPIGLGVQTCDTQCQSDKTDCELACDQVVSCVTACQKVAVACVDRCRSAPPPPAEKEAPPKKTPPAPAKGARPPPKAKKP
jgi:hypothetical protein